MNSLSDAHRAEVQSGDRFSFGKNWSRFLKRLNDDRIALAERSLKEMLGVDTLDGKSFLDVGSGSGLFSLAARRLGARVHSFDYDPASVACTTELRRRYFPQDALWTVEAGSVLSEDYLGQLGQWDIVYSWGVLHHTGQMWNALNNVKPLVRMGGTLFIAIYNDLGETTDSWSDVKKRYNALPESRALAFALKIIAQEEWKSLSGHMQNGGPMEWVRSWTQYDRQSFRGMSKWHDWIDWIGGYPYERATVEVIADYYADDGFRLLKLRDQTSGYGCNEFVFRREGDMGTHISQPLPGGNTFARQYGHRVTMISDDEGGRTGAIPEALLVSAQADLLLFKDKLFLGPAEVSGEGKIRLGIDDRFAADTKYYLVSGRVIRPGNKITKGEGHTFIWNTPELAEFSDNSAEPRRSPVYVFEDGTQLAVPHAPHVDIGAIGKGRFSHWGNDIYLSTRTNDDPAGHNIIAIQAHTRPAGSQTQAASQ